MMTFYLNMKGNIAGFRFKWKHTRASNEYFMFNFGTFQIEFGRRAIKFRFMVRFGLLMNLCGCYTFI